MVKLNDLIELVPAGAKCSWISPLHPVEKPNGQPKTVKIKGVTSQMRANVEKSRIRVTSDNKRLNKAIIRMRRPMPSVSQLQFYLAGNEWFSKVDIRDAFLQVVLDADGRILTTFSTPWGLYRYKRLNMGLCTASEIFQEVILSQTSGLRNIKVAIDDIMVYGKTLEEHDSALESLMARLTEMQITLNKSKC